MAEFALVFPILMTMLVGVFELGNGILVNQKSIAASQAIADLITRNESVDDALLAEAIRAGELSIAPYDLDELGIDIVSVSYDDEDLPQEVWRETVNIAAPDEDLADRATGLGVEGDGVVIVVVQYTYRPLLAWPLTGEIEMEEVSFARGRTSPIVCFEDDCG